MQILCGKGTHDWPNDQAQISHQGPNPYHPNTISRIEHVLHTANDYSAGDCREKSTQDSAEDNTFERSNGGDDNTGNAICGCADDVQLLSPKALRVRGQDNTPKGLP